MKQLKVVFQNPNYVKLFLATFTSQMGNVIGMTAFMFYLLHRFSSQPSYATLAELMYSLPTLVVFFIVGVVVDRMNRQKIAANCDWISALLSIGLLLAVWIDWIPLIFVFLFVRSAISKFFLPAESSLIQGILDKETYTVAAGLNQIMGSLFLLFGGALGAMAYWSFGIMGAILIDALSFVASALLIQACSIQQQTLLPNGPHTWKDLKLKLIATDFKDGFAYILRNKLLLLLVMGFFIFGIVNGGLSVIPIFILKYKLAPTDYEQYSVWIGIIVGVALLAGSLVASVLSSKMKLYQLIATGLLISGVFLAAAGLMTNLYLFFVLAFMTALALPAVNIGLGGWLPRIVAPQMMGRVQGWIGPLMMLSHSLTLGLIGISFPAVVSIEALFLIIGGCFVLAALYYFAVLPRFVEDEPLTPSQTQSAENAPSV
ncbi:MFS transporter [Paenibacillus elgii]|uniref:MFS transporter n=1 Tax=Paenibacillus elgii TaxID=189691 RepID=A0A164ANX6_9BACL|nr:MFS transporter [Paenibacillus elgii]KZE84295.1 MFS transporter [Paenibacillus elgii]